MLIILRNGQTKFWKNFDAEWQEKQVQTSTSFPEGVAAGERRIHVRIYFSPLLRAVCRTQKPKPKVINNNPAKALTSVEVLVACARVVVVSVPDLSLTVIVSLSLLPP